MGAEVPNWVSPAFPPLTPLNGQYCALEPLTPDRHGVALFEANRLDSEGRNWTYLSYGPFDAVEGYLDWVRSVTGPDHQDPQFWAIIDKSSGKPAGVASYLRIDPRNGSIEVGHLNFSPLIQRSRAATDAMYLMMRRAFELGYRRYEWKCHALNDASRAAARRLGFSFEGVFRQATISKGRNRDTAWYSVIDCEWPALDRAFRRWLDPANFDADGRQHQSLSSLTSFVHTA